MLLIYGFGPFDEFEDNITMTVLERLSPELRPFSHVFDVDFDAAMFESRLERTRPDYVLGLGQITRGERLRIESRAVNRMAGRNARPGPIDAGVAEPARAMSWELPGDAAIESSDDAGTYVCNFSMWIAEDWARRHDARAAFIHVPRQFDPERAARYVERATLPLLNRQFVDGM